MSSILKVDQLQDSGGNAIITSDGGGNITTNKVGITMADQWRLTANITANADPITSNLERVDTSSFGYIGTGMTESSGIFTFPSTGIWLIRATRLSEAIADDNVLFKINVTTNNSTYYNIGASGVNTSDDGGSSNSFGAIYSEYLIDVTSTSLVKVKFDAISNNNATVYNGDSSSTNDGSSTRFIFKRIGDTWWIMN